MTKKKSVSKNIGKYVVKKTVTVTKTIKKRKQHKYLRSLTILRISGYYTAKETVQTVNLALNSSVGALPTYPTIPLIAQMVERLPEEVKVASSKLAQWATFCGVVA